ncbi:MAG: DEAD/DEAH box helicase [Methanomassiliicoccales archaeon]|nr:DEAD/DEAH box helicase [Methanomassiliicoccales archaeon]
MTYMPMSDWKSMLPQGAVDILREEGITSLYPPQELSIPYALEGRNLVLAVPTASGKSLVAYLAAVRRVLQDGGKVLYIVPLRALAAEKYEELKRFEPLGIKVGISVGDYDEVDKGIDQLDVLIATSEKADAIMRHRADWIRQMSLVVADEVHLMNDPDRGPTLEITLTKLRMLNPQVQVIALSATVGNSREMAEWLDAEHVASDWRPVELKEGVLLADTINFTDNSHRKVRLLGDTVWSLVKDTMEEGGQVLVFVNTRKSTETLAVRFAKLNREKLDAAAAKELEDAFQEEHTSIGTTLRDCMRTGMAFHNAALSNEQRRTVERFFKAGRIKCIVATPTLAAGINLPARRVVVRDVNRFDDGGYVPLPVMEVKQMCGRAGRPRYDPYGEAVLIAKSLEQSHVLLENYLLGEPEDVVSKVGNERVLRGHVLALIATETASSRKGLVEFLGRTFFCHQRGEEGVEEAVENIVRYLFKEGLIRCPGTDLLVEGPGADLRTTFFGRRVSDLYIDPVSAAKLRDALMTFTPGKRELGLMHAVCSTPDMLNLYLRRDDADILSDILTQRRGELLSPVPELDSPDYEYFLSELKTALVLDSWVEERDEEEVLRAFGIGPGDLHNKVEVGEWLLYSMRELSNIFNKDCYPVLTKLMARMRYGVKEELLELVALRGVGRVRARSLFKKGYTSLEALKEAPVTDIAKVIGIGELLAQRIKQQVDPLFVPEKRARGSSNARQEVVPKEAPVKQGQTKLFQFD